MIICAGESLIDMLPRESQAQEPCFAPYPGGAVFNTAIALGRLGETTAFVSGISTDLFGQVLIDALAESGVGTGLAVRQDRPTTLAFVQLVDGQASYAFYDENTAGRMLTPQQMPALPADTRAAFFGGISLVAEPCGAAYESLMLTAAPDVVTMIDPNIRPGFITDEPAYRNRLDRMIAAADIVKISDEDLHWLKGAGTEAELAAELLAMGPSLVCVTRGADGANGYTRAGCVHAPSQRVNVVDTVGAGDTFNAGLLAGLSRAGALAKGALAELDAGVLRAALDLGAACAAVTVSRAGANPPWADEL